MPLDSTAELHLRRALHLAEEAAAFASPNPTVGCVIAHGERILGEGAHLYENFDHAEIVALKQAASLGHDVNNATAHVTLEPCAHHGRTGPCSEALIAAGIGRCFIATVDPNPLVRGQGIAKLRATGIEVTIADPHSQLAQQARTLNDAFAFSIQHGRPFVTLKAALSRDGYLAPPPSTRSARAPHWLTGEAARFDVRQLRHASDAILTGIGTILADDPSLTDRTELPRRRPLLRVILDPDLRTPLTSTLLSATVILNDEASPNRNVISTEGALFRRSGETPVFIDAKNLLIFCAPLAPTDREAALVAAGAEVARISTTLDNRLDLNAVLTELASRKIFSILIEAGSTLNSAFLHASLVDKLILYYAPTDLGPDALPLATGIASPREIESQLTGVIHTTTFPHNDNEDIRITGYLHDPWSTIEK